MPTDKNYTGQQLDSQSGLLYGKFCWYDPLTGEFTRTDTKQDNAIGMNPYAYVGDNPETKNDPTGHRIVFANAAIDPGSIASNGIQGAYGYISVYANTQKAYAQDIIQNGKDASYASKAYMRRYASANPDHQTVADLQADTAPVAEELDQGAKTLGVFGKALMLVGAAIDGLDAGLDYYSQNPQQGVAAAVGVGVGHAVLSTAGSLIGAGAGSEIGEAVGGILGTALIPIPGLGTAVGILVGGAVGGALGGFAGSWLGDQVASSWAPAESSVGTDAGNVVSSIGSWISSW